MRTATILATLLQDILAYRRTVPCGRGAEPRLRLELHQAYLAYVSTKERQAHEAIRQLFKHNIFHLALPPQSILSEDLFSKRTWEFLGLSDRQIILAGALGGAALGVGIDAATIGTSFGLFSAIGGLVGAGATALKGKELLTGVRLLGMKMGGEQLQVGPVSNIQLLYILLDRGLLYYSHVINWAHGRRDYAPQNGLQRSVHGKTGFTSHWDSERRKICSHFFRSVQKGQEGLIEEASATLQDLLREQLQEISEDRAQACADKQREHSVGSDD
jgi:hypothetical protein